MLHLHSTRAARVAVSLALAATGLAAALPATASAKKPKPLTKSQVIALIKKYSKPGPAGKQGATGPAGSYTIGHGLAASSLAGGGTSIAVADGAGLAFDAQGNLEVAAGGGLGYDDGKLTLASQSCPIDQYSYGFDSAGQVECNYAPTIEANSGTFNGASGHTSLGTGSAPSATSIASIPLNGTSGGNTYFFAATADVENVSGSTTIVACSIVDSTTSSVIETQSISVPNGGEMSVPLMWDATGPDAGDTVELQCGSSNGTGVTAAGTLSAFPNG